MHSEVEPEAEIEGVEVAVERTHILDFPVEGCITYISTTHTSVKLCN